MKSPSSVPLQAPSGTFTQTWHLAAAAVILFMVVGVFTGRNIQQTDRYVAGLMDERGSALIEVFETSLRNELRIRSGLRVQEFLEDMAASDDIMFIALVLDNGKIIAHSDPNRVGGTFMVADQPASPEVMHLLKLSDDNTSRDSKLMRMEGSLCYVVHNTLFHADIRIPARFGPPLNYLPYPLSRYVSPTLAAMQPMQMFVGLDALPLRKMQEQNMRSGLFAGVLILTASMAVIIAMRHVERGIESRRRMQVAETLAQSMVDEVRRLEKEMRMREKQAAVGDLAAGVAHELRNPLSSIKGYATYFSSRFPPGSEDQEAAEIMVQEVDRLNRVITDLIGVAKPAYVHPVLTDLHQLMEGIIRLLAQDARQRGVHLASQGEPVKALVDPDRLRQALLNVCLNAVEAMPDGGKLLVQLQRNDATAIIEVIDNGPGMSADVLNRMFDPYFTTKSQGTGLGMVMVLKIVEAHGGTVQVDSTPGLGTRVRIALPLSGTDSLPDKASSPSLSLTKSSDI